MIDNDKSVTGNHILQCQNCGNDISSQKNHTHIKLYEQFGVCLCNKCAVELLKKYGHFIEPTTEDKKNLNFLNEKELVIVCLCGNCTYDNNNRVNGL